MDASYLWLRELCSFDADPAAVSAALTRRGITVDSVTPFGADTRFEIDVPANRPDCLGHRGLARELSAAFGVALNDPEAAAKVAAALPATGRAEVVALADAGAVIR